MFQKNALLSFLLSATLLGRASSAATFEVDWLVLLASKTGTATVGDKVRFIFPEHEDFSESTPFHNVYIHKDATCDTAGSIFVTDVPSSYTFTAEDVGEVVFACQVDTHCQDGQLMIFTVSASKESEEEVVASKDSEEETVDSKASEEGTGASDRSASPTFKLIMSSGLVAAAIGFALV